jgi:hypothetical protein
MALLNQAGNKHNPKFMDLQFAMQEYEEEADSRDLNDLAKTS